MAIAVCSDQEFIATWMRLQSPSQVAKALNISERAVQARRRRLEVQHGALPLEDRRYKYSPVAASTRPGHISLGIEEGVVIVFSDAHFHPGIRTAAYDGLLWAIREFQPKAVICNGDAFDGAQISRHPRIQWDEKPSVVQELKACEIALGEIEDTAKKARHNVKLAWPAGNHDLRLEARLAANVPEFQGVKGFTLKDHFPNWAPCWAVWPTEDLVVKHRFKNGLHATHLNAVNAGKSIVTGHLHSLKVTPFSDYSARPRWGVDTGTLADTHGPQFLDYCEANPVNWRSGFAVLTIFQGVLLWPELVHVFDNEHVEFRGKVIQVAA